MRWLGCAVMRATSFVVISAFLPFGGHPSQKRNDFGHESSFSKSLTSFAKYSALAVALSSAGLQARGCLPLFIYRAGDGFLSRSDF